MSLHVKSTRDLGRWQALADGAGLTVDIPARRKRPKRDRSLYRADLLKAIDRAPSDLARRVLRSALERWDEEHP